MTWAWKGRNRHESQRRSHLICPTTAGKAHAILPWNGNGKTGCGWKERRKEVGNTKEDKAVVISEVKKDRERWVTWNESGKAAGFLHTGNSAYRNKIHSSP